MSISSANLTSGSVYSEQRLTDVDLAFPTFISWWCTQLELSTKWFRRESRLKDNGNGHIHSFNYSRKLPERKIYGVSYQIQTSKQKKKYDDSDSEIKGNCGRLKFGWGKNMTRPSNREAASLWARCAKGGSSMEINRAPVRLSRLKSKTLINRAKTKDKRDLFCRSMARYCGLELKEDGSPNNLLLAIQSRLHAAVRMPLSGACCWLIL